VPDIEAAVADLQMRGVHVQDYAAPDPITVDGVADMGHSWAAWFIDPSGNVLAVVQPKG
jgi:predicted enzyme related to lactoylglutathione lyase